MNNKKITLCVCLLVLSLVFVGFMNKIPKTWEMDKKPISISDIEIQPMKNGKTEVFGSVTNNGKYDCNMCVRIVYKNFDGIKLYTQEVQIANLKVGKTIYYSNNVKGVDISNTTHEVTFAHFFTYVK